MPSAYRAPAAGDALGIAEVVGALGEGAGRITGPRPPTETTSATPTTRTAATVASRAQAWNRWRTVVDRVAIWTRSAISWAVGSTRAARVSSAALTRRSNPSSSAGSGR